MLLESKTNKCTQYIILKNQGFIFQRIFYGPHERSKETLKIRFINKDSNQQKRDVCTNQINNHNDELIFILHCFSNHTTWKMPANKNIPVNWRVYPMIVSRLQVNYTVKKAFHWTAIKSFSCMNKFDLWFTYRKALMVDSRKFIAHGNGVQD